MTTPTHEKRKMVTIFDILVFLKTYSGTNCIQDFTSEWGLPEDVVDGMFDIAEDLGYIDENNVITAQGETYYAECIEPREFYGVLTLIRGLPGAGKTNLARIITAEKKSRGHTKIVHLESDQFMVDENGHYKFQIDKVKSSNVECIAQTERYLRMGYDVVVSNAFAQYWELKPYYDVAAELNIKTVLIEMQSQFISERRSAKTRQQMVEKWDKVFLPRSWASHNKEKHKVEPTPEQTPSEGGAE